MKPFTAEWWRDMADLADLAAVDALRAHYAHNSSGGYHGTRDLRELEAAMRRVYAYAKRRASIAAIREL